MAPFSRAANTLAHGAEASEPYVHHFGTNGKISVNSHFTGSASRRNNVDMSLGAYSGRT
jgi:hypothetical protein